MENLKSSGPIDQRPMTEDNEMIVVKNLDCYGSTSTMSLVRINGVQYIKKQLLPEYDAQPYFRNLFRKEYEAGRRLDSPYVIRYERFVENEEETYILTEYVSGCTLEEKIDDEPQFFSKRKNLDKLMCQLLDGLESMHEHQILHLDLKPDNIMFTQVGENVKIIDLGFCFTDAYSHTSGYTPGFAAPEQEKRHSGAVSKLDERTDIYAIGKLLQYIEKECDNN